MEAERPTHEIIQVKRRTNDAPLLPKFNSLFRTQIIHLLYRVGRIMSGNSCDGAQKSSLGHSKQYLKAGSCAAYTSFLRTASTKTA